MIYGQRAYAGFATAIASRLGLKVELVDGDAPCIDKDGTIYLPNMSNYQTQIEFEQTCGTIIHEMAHQFYKSHEQIDEKRSQLEHQCLNAALDVADETWISAYFSKRLGNSRPATLLNVSNYQALAGPNSTKYIDWRDESTHVWKILCAGIFNARGVPGSDKLKETTISYASLLVDVRKCFALLEDARLASGEDSTPTGVRFFKLKEIAKKLAEILAPLAKTMTPSSPKIAAPGAAVKDALAKGQKNAMGQQATESDGEKLGSGASALGSSSGKYQFSEESFRVLAPSVERIAQRIAIDGDSAVLHDQMNTGSRLAQAYRILTDGQALARWEESPMADGVSVSILVDLSGSMMSIIPQVTGIARAFAIGMRECGAVQTLGFGSKLEESYDDFASTICLGGTRTDLAINAGTKFLKKQNGEKWMIVITDGVPDSVPATNAACAAAIAKGIKILAIGLGHKIEMTGAKSIVARDCTRLAIELDNAAHDIERV